MERFKIGDQIELIPGHYNEEDNNPIKTRGVITSVQNVEHCYSVKWDNDTTNSYREHELKPYLMPDIKAKVGDLIIIHRDNSAYWITAGTNYIVQAVDPMTTRIKINGQWWACDNDDYTVLSSQAGESTFDKEALLKQERRIVKENALQKAGKYYHAGVKFKSMQSGDVYTVADRPGYEWSENTEGIYLWGISPQGYKLRVYICKRGDWAEIIDNIYVEKDGLLKFAQEHYLIGTKFKSLYNDTIHTVDSVPKWSEDNHEIFVIDKEDRTLRHIYDKGIDKWAEIIHKDLLAEAKEKFPPGTRFTNAYGSTSVVDDNPEYSLASSNVYAKCISGKRVCICSAGVWKDIVSRPSAIVTSTPKSHFDVGDVVEVIEKTHFFNVGHVGTIERCDTHSVLMLNHTGDSWWISKDNIKHHTVSSKTSTFDIKKAQEQIDKVLNREALDEQTTRFVLGLPTLSKEELAQYFYSQTKTNKHGTESKQSVKLQGINLQIREGNSIRGIGLKSSGSKIKLGSNNSYN